MRSRTPFFSVKKEKTSSKIVSISILQIVYCVFWLVFSSAVYYLFLRESLEAIDYAVAPRVPSAVIVFFLVTVAKSVLGIAGAIGIRNRHLWARRILVSVSCLELVYAPIGTIIGIETIRTLRSDRANEHFGIKKQKSRFTKMLETLEKRKNAVRSLRVSYISLFFFGGITCFGPLFLPNFLKDAVVQAEFPFGELKGIAVDRAGNIYCVSGYYSTIQVYDRGGKFIRTHFIAPGKQTIAIMIDEDNLLHIAVRGTDMHYVYSDDGVLVREMEGEGEALYDEIKNMGPHMCIDKNRNVYTIRGSWIYPHVMKTTTLDENKRIISVPFFLWIIMAPFPAIIYLVLGFLLMMLYEMVS